mmetsp:Transcript_13998/g.34173  ORF Transcript_13998/g.34173 Transcript_13998/m.34173 type:complete len:373 (-) Transcript_13998:238-1356(-)|eukprot:CAMPEP_0114486414 /NCGR_PEP_ID=MMETSP0109-20121206/202_1 /TAXON_ID=29199 /ORGANISM="Chlorarachnion reptans, Strain CCCM449" /LENGTH=372 /DNA_ID=CAMNT_0001662575 /DNA_START=64 /DNA_END=1182 /DNA_ORIENTATION=+
MESFGGDAIPSFLTPNQQRVPVTRHIEEPRYRSIPLRVESDSKATRGLGLGSLNMPGLGRTSQSHPFPSFISPTGHMAPPQKQPVYRNLPFVSQGVPTMRSIQTEEAFPVKPRVLPPFYERNTSFSSMRPAHEIFRAVGKALSPHKTEANPDKGKYKGTAWVIGQLVTFQVHLFSVPDGGHLVEFQRRRGDSCAFWHFFKNTMEELGDELADAAAFLKSFPKCTMRKSAALPIPGKQMKLSEKTLDSLKLMATDSFCLGSKLDALQCLNAIVDAGKDRASSSCHKVGEVTMKACAAKDDLLSHCGKSILSGMMKPETFTPQDSPGDVADYLAKITVSNMKSVSSAPKEYLDFSKGDGRVPDLGSREPVNLYN